jgi:uncharacterized protein (DUF1778 family)
MGQEAAIGGMLMTAVEDLEQLDLHIPAAVKERWERAAALAGVPVAAFVALAATERAEALIGAHDSLALTPEESAWLFEYLRQPAREPAPAMRKAARRHRELFGDEF